MGYWQKRLQYWDLCVYLDAFFMKKITSSNNQVMDSEVGCTSTKISRREESSFFQWDSSHRVNSEYQLLHNSLYSSVWRHCFLLNATQHKSVRTSLDKNCRKEARFSSYHAGEDVEEKPVVVVEHLSAPSAVNSACSVLMQHAAVRHKEIRSRWKKLYSEGRWRGG